MLKAVSSTKNDLSLNNDKNKQQKNNPNFKGLGAFVVNAPSALSAAIDRGGFVTSFLVQDTLGMTAPRSKEGFQRNREKGTKFKDLNFKEGIEVFLREFLSGIFMMMMPFAVFGATKKLLGKSSFTNTELLKKIGKGFTETVKNKNTEATATDVKKGFYKNIISKVVKHSNPEVTSKTLQNRTIDNVLAHIEKIEELEAKLPNAKDNGIWTKFTNLFSSKENKVVSEKSNIVNQISEAKEKIAAELNGFHKTHSDDMDLVNRVKIDNDVFRINDTIDAMRGYAQDAAKNKALNEFTEDSSKAFQKTSMSKRIFSTIAASIGTIGATSIVPKIYSILNPVSPGIDENAGGNVNIGKFGNKTNNKEKDSTPQKGLAFKGGASLLKQMQFDGNQLTPILMTTLATVGLIGPRTRTAIKRAPIDIDGKKNKIEVPEILTRDTISIGTVVFAVPMLTKAVVSSYQKASGFVLMNDKKDAKLGQKIKDLINPLSPVSTYSVNDLKEIYGNIDSQAKLKNFARFIDKNDGHLAKVFGSIEDAHEMFNNKGINLKSLAKQDNKIANATIINAIKDFDDAKVKQLFKPLKGKDFSEIFYKARRLSGTPKAIATLVIVPYFLGFVLPKFVYGITAKNKAKHEKKMQEYLLAHPELNIKKPEMPVVTNNVDMKNSAFQKFKSHRS